MALRLRYLPHDIPMAPVETSGYAAAFSKDTALGGTGLQPCERDDCILRGDQTPELLGGYEAMHQAAAIANEQRNCAERKRRLFGSKAADDLGFVFHVEIEAAIAMPPPSLARAMARGMAPAVWEALRPHAADGVIHGIDLPQGRIIFRQARLAGHYSERLMTSMPALDLP